MSRVVTLGEAMVLFLADPGTPLRAATIFRRSVAGAEANVAVGLSRLGHEVHFVGRVGADALGELVRATFRADGVDVSGLRDDNRAPTGVLVRDAVPYLPVETVYVRAGSAGSRVTPEDVPAALGPTDLVHVTGITPLLSASARAATHALLDRAQAAGVPVSVDPNLRWTLAHRDVVLDRSRELLTRADLVLAAADELAALDGRHRDQVITAPGASAPGARLIVVKTGDGAVAAPADRPPLRDVTPRVASVDPVGAGDAFDVGFLDAWLRERPIAEALAMAARAGRAVASVPTDLDGLPRAAHATDSCEDVRR